MSFLSLLDSWLDTAHSFLWSIPFLLFFLGFGLYLHFVLLGFPLRYLPLSLREIVFPSATHKKVLGDISPFQSIMTTLAASLGIGNIAGVATAITVGGWGALFWMWVTALLGMSIKYAEAFLAVRYRTVDEKGEMCGGPMVFIRQALGWKFLAGFFALCGAISAFGGGNILQANSVADVLSSSVALSPLVTGMGLFLFLAVTLIGGIRSIGRLAAFVVPFMALLYVMGTLAIVVPRADLIPSILREIFRSAFHLDAAKGGAVGTALLLTIQTGVARGLMTSEAGLGTASIAAAAAKTNDPPRQALLSMGGSFVATLILCTLTGIALGVTGILHLSEATGATLTRQAFELALPKVGGPIVTASLLLFACTTLLGWAYYGEKCIEYLLGPRAIIPYRIAFSVVAFLGAILELRLAWRISDLTNGLMALPNLLALCALSPIVIRETALWRSTQEQPLRRE